jgi:hypothetical protein
MTGKTIFQTAVAAWVEALAFSRGERSGKWAFKPTKNDHRIGGALALVVKAGYS